MCVSFLEEIFFPLFNKSELKFSYKKNVKFTNKQIE